MATRPDTIAHPSDLLGAAFSYRKLFGEYAMHPDGKEVALIRHDQLFAKPTPGVCALVRSELWTTGDQSADLPSVGIMLAETTAPDG